MSLYNSIKKQKLSYAGHLLRESAKGTILQILEGKMNSQTAKGRPRRMWDDDIKNWMSLDSYEQIKNTIILAVDRRSCC